MTPIYRKAAPGGEATSAAVDYQGGFAAATSGGGTSLPYLGEMEAGFGQDFSDIQAYVDNDPAGGLAEMGAAAATDGKSVAFNTTSPSRELVAHELAHVAQHRSGSGAGVNSFSLVADHDSPAEREADSVAARVASGERGVQVGGSASAALHRSPTTDANKAFIVNQIKMADVANDIPRLTAIQKGIMEALMSPKPAKGPDEVKVKLDGVPFVVERKSLMELNEQVINALATPPPATTAPGTTPPGTPPAPTPGGQAPPPDAAAAEHRLVLTDSAKPLIHIWDYNYLNEHLGDFMCSMQVGVTETGQVYPIFVKGIPMMNGRAAVLSLGADISGASVNQGGEHYVDINYTIRLGGPSVTSSEGVEFGGEVGGHEGGPKVGGKFSFSRASTSSSGATFVRQYRVTAKGGAVLVWQEVVDQRLDIEEDQLVLDDDDVGDTWDSLNADWNIETHSGPFAKFTPIPQTTAKASPPPNAPPAAKP